MSWFNIINVHGSIAPTPTAPPREVLPHLMCMLCYSSHANNAHQQTGRGRNKRLSRSWDHGGLSAEEVTVGAYIRQSRPPPV